jgi:hypothetical protein
MRDVVYDYDKDLYNRSFLNCYQRQSVVMLAERVPNVHYLFHRCLISTDQILDQIIRRQRPRYSFESRFFDPADLERIGVVREDVPVDSYAAARPLLLDVVDREEYALLVIDVFYLPHCPEYRQQHVIHTIVLREYDATARQWSIIDDNPASLLCEYTYPEEVIAASYDNNELRNVRYFTASASGSDEAAAHIRAAFSEMVRAHRDSYTLFRGIRDILACPWIAPDRMISLLRHAFLVYQGSRTCLREYVRQAAGDPSAAASLGDIVARAGEVQNVLLLATVTGTVDAEWMTSACRDLEKAEDGLLQVLLTAG